MLLFYIQWLKHFGVASTKLRVHLHLYADMNIKKQEKYWSQKLSLPLSQFRKSYIKKSSISSLVYKNGIGQGTCSVIVNDTRLKEKILMGIDYIQNSLIS